VPKVRLAAVSEVPEGGMTMREHDGRTVMLAKIDGKIYAMNDTCTHSGAPLHMGELGTAGSPYLLTCPWHAAHFDVSTGKVYQDTPWATDTETYPVEIAGEDVLVELSD
jgi:3-phenylpropionate/trans-cinnamate dioxygenase ferredoxin component